MPDTPPPAYPPETIEGWYVLHQIFRLDSVHRPPTDASSAVLKPRTPDAATEGWSAAARLIGSTSDVLVVHFRPTLDAIGEAQRALLAESWMRALTPTYAFLSMTEVGLYHITSELAQAAALRGGQPGDAEYTTEMRTRVANELQNPHVHRRLYPPYPRAMPYICFYPMSKRRAPQQNWYALPLETRSHLMRAHGTTGRKYTGRVQQVISGAIGFDAWEWGVTLFSADPLEFKKLVTEMRFDEVSAQYADFGEFYVGKMGTLSEVLRPD